MVVCCGIVGRGACIQSLLVSVLLLVLVFPFLSSREFSGLTPHMGSGTWIELAGETNLHEKGRQASISMDVSGNNAQHIQWWGCLSSTHSYYLRGCKCARKRTQTRRASWCAGCVIKLLKVSSMYLLVVPPLHRISTQPWRSFPSRFCKT